MAKILHIIHNIELGGVEVGLLSSFDKLNDKLDYHILVLGTIDNSMLKKIPTNIHNKIVCVSSFSAIGLIRYFTHSKFNYIVTSLWKAHFLGLILKLFHFKVIPFIHNGKYFHFFDSTFSQLIILFSNKIFVDSHSTFLFLKNNRLFKNKNIIEAPFIEEIKFYPKVNRINSVIKFCSVSRLNKSKNIDSVITFLKYLDNQDIDFVYDIYGPDQDALKDLKNQISILKLDNKIFYRGDLQFDYRIETISQYNYYIQFSLVEGFSKSVYEAMLVGVVPIVYPAGEIKNYCIDNFNSYVLRNFNTISIETINKITNNIYFQYLSKNAINVKKYPTLSNVLIKEFII